MDRNLHHTRSLRLVGSSSSAAMALAHPQPQSIVRENYLGASFQSQILATSLRYSVKPLLSVWAKWPHLPWPTGAVDLAGSMLPAVPGTRYRTVQLPHCRAEWIKAEEVNAQRVVLYLHGGAFLTCGLRTHRRMVSLISAASRTPVLSVDYRMLPRYTINDSVEDGIDAYRWLLRRGYRPDQIVIGGDSAGGYLAFMVTLALRSQGIPVPAGIIALAPLTNLNPASKMAHSNAKTCSLFSADVMNVFTEYADRVEQRLMINGAPGPRVCPVDSDLSGLPPTLLQVGSTELLLPDSEMIADRLAHYGVPCQLQVWDRQVHVFQAAAGIVPEATRAIREIGRFVQDAVPASARHNARSLA
ncbi:alpha/beta hydrolase [Hoyosella rhizosphaerae]|uniref:Esterase n=1 Tax=Hoyosella rhizosphaerae TaxID=1755582 RepID=A0A916U8W7_9ACTN|nr:alpha/beta hydrolase [Hoyosella rhizosphaerae]MBN4927632.1 alpha/beta hydrolase [Hoyosella rhizosphaerae]GGC62928.1 esterase [Hoyosella rhizosphaerae]